jgi:hypothetical protein
MCVCVEKMVRVVRISWLPETGGDSKESAVSS